MTQLEKTIKIDASGGDGKSGSHNCLSQGVLLWLSEFVDSQEYWISCNLYKNDAITVAQFWGQESSIALMQANWPSDF